MQDLTKTKQNKNYSLFSWMFSATKPRVMKSEIHQI